VNDQERPLSPRGLQLLVVASLFGLSLGVIAGGLVATMIQPFAGVSFLTSWAIDSSVGAIGAGILCGLVWRRICERLDTPKDPE
jgi:hypothetical protein